MAYACMHTHARMIVSNLNIQMGAYTVAACGMPPPPYEALPYEIPPQLFDFDIILGIKHLLVANICILM